MIKDSNLNSYQTDLEGDEIIDLKKYRSLKWINLRSILGKPLKVEGYDIVNGQYGELTCLHTIIEGYPYNVVTSSNNVRKFFTYFKENSKFPLECVVKPKDFMAKNDCGDMEKRTYYAVEEV